MLFRQTRFAQDTFQRSRDDSIALCSLGHFRLDFAGTCFGSSLVRQMKVVGDVWAARKVPLGVEGKSQSPPCPPHWLLKRDTISEKLNRAGNSPCGQLGLPKASYPEWLLPRSGVEENIAPAKPEQQCSRQRCCFCILDGFWKLRDRGGLECAHTAQF